MSVGTKHPHYHKDVSNLQTVDVYRVLALFNVTKMQTAPSEGTGSSHEERMLPRRL